MTSKSALVQLSVEEVKDEAGNLLGIVQRWGHHTGRGNSLYLYEPFNGREPGIATSRVQALAIIHTVPPEALHQPEVVVETHELEHGFIYKVKDRMTRRIKYRWTTLDARLSGDAGNYGEALTALGEATNAPV